MDSSLLLQHAIEGMSTWLRVERNLAPRTRAAYVADLERFDTWARETLSEHDGIAIQRLNKELLQDYLRHLRAERGCKPPTINRAAASLRVLFAWCTQEGHLTENPTDELAQPKLPRKLPVYLTRDEVDRLFAAPDQSTLAGRRDHAILITLAYTGVRLSELVGMNTIDIDYPRAQPIFPYSPSKTTIFAPFGVVTPAFSVPVFPKIAVVETHYLDVVAGW